VLPPLTVKHTGSTTFLFRPILHRISPYPHQLRCTFTPPGLPHHIDSRIRLRHTISHCLTPHAHSNLFPPSAAVPRTVKHIYWVSFPLFNVYPSACAHTNPHTISHHPTPLKPLDLCTPHQLTLPAPPADRRNQSHFHHFDCLMCSLV
jgi:hypothetical protein